VIKVVAFFLLAALLSGCSTVQSIFGSEDNSEPPAKLENLVDEVKLKELWSASVGVGYDGHRLPVVTRYSWPIVRAG